MNPTTPQQPIDINSILQMLAGSAQHAQGNAQKYGDMLAQRRQFVNATNAGLMNQANSAIDNGSNGQPISPANLLPGITQQIVGDADRTGALTQQMFGYQSQANDLLGKIAQLGSDQANRGIQQQGLNLQERGQNLQYGVGDANGNTIDPTTGGTGSPTGMNGAQAVTEVQKQKGADILSQAKSPAEQYRIAQQVLAAGGVANYRKLFNDPVAQQNLDKANQTNATLQSITRAQDAIAHSKRLQGFLDANPLEKGVIEMAIKSGNQNLLDHLGFSPTDIKAIGDLTTLSAVGDRDLIGGRLSGYLSGALNTAQPSIYKGSKDNQQFLQTLKDNIANGVTNYSKQYGYGSPYDVPGIAKVKVKTSDGKVGMISPLEYNPNQMQMIP